MTSPITTEWLGLPADIRSAAETAVGHLRPLTHAETLLIVGRAIKAERERDGWQPIETAPKDGEPILATNARYAYTLQRCQIVFWDDGWRGQHDDDDDPRMDWLTHWAPLPEPPSAAAASLPEIGPGVPPRVDGFTVEGGTVINWGEAINTAVKDILPPKEAGEVTRKRRRPGIYDGTYVGVVFENGAFVRFMTDEEYDEKFQEASTDRSAGWEHGEGGEDE